MAMPVGFQQDPQMPFGVGTFELDDGSSIYHEDPELAAQLSGAPDMRVAGPGGAGGAPPAPAPAPGLTPHQQQYLPPGVAYRGPPPTPTQAPLGEVVVTPAMQKVTAPAAPVVKQAQPPIGPPPPPPPAPPAPRMSWGAVKGGVVPQSVSQTIEGQGAPFTQEDAEAFADMNLQNRMVHQSIAERQAAQAQAEALAYQAKIPELQRQAAQAQLQQDVIQGAVNNEEQGLRGMIEEANQLKRKGVNPHRLYQERGAFGTIGMAIAQGLGAYAATLGRSQNFAQQIIDKEIDRDIAAQERALDDSQGSVNNALAQLQRRYGSLEQAKSALKILQHETANAEIKSWESQAKAAGMLEQFELWNAENQEKQAQRLLEFRDKSMQKVTTKTESKVVQPRAAGSRPLTEEEKLDRENKLYEKVNKNLDLRGKNRKLQSGGEDKESPLYVEGYGTARTESEAKAIRSEIADYHARERDLDEAEKLDKSGWSKFGAKIPFVGPVGSSEYTRGLQLRERGATATARSYGGPITASDREAAALVTPDPTRVVGNQQEVIKSARENNRRLLEERIQQVVVGDNPALPKRREVEP